MAQTILEFRLETKKREAIAEICRRLGIQVVEVQLGSEINVADKKKFDFDL